jgi:hypothetical protein
VVLSVSEKCDAFISEDEAVLGQSDPPRSLKAWGSTHPVTQHHIPEDLTIHYLYSLSQLFHYPQAIADRLL